MAARVPSAFLAAALMTLAAATFAADDAPPLSGESVYQLDAAWTDQDGRTVHLADFRGKPRLITMVYTTCEYSCPLVVEEIRKILGRLPASNRSQVGAILVSFDTDRDTPEQMKKFAAAKKLDPATWALLKGNAGSVREMAAMLGINYKQTGGGEYSHTNAVTVLDQNGVIRYRSPALGSGGKEAAAEIEKLLN